ncbi:hypothetical protein ACIBL5_21860 [Streptomyces sp. NPDC050516]
MPAWTVQVVYLADRTVHTSAARSLAVNGQLGVSYRDLTRH